MADRPRAMAQLAAIKPGSGYLDVASDLGELSRLHRQNDDRIAGDTSGRYRPDDAEQALGDATAIIRELSQSADPREAEAWADALARTWTLLLTAYGRITRAAAWLYGERADLDALFPSLFAVGRGGGRATTANTAAAPESSAS